MTQLAGVGHVGGDVGGPRRVRRDQRLGRGDEVASPRARA